MRGTHARLFWRDGSPRSGLFEDAPEVQRVVFRRAVLGDRCHRGFGHHDTCNDGAKLKERVGLQSFSKPSASVDSKTLARTGVGDDKAASFAVDHGVEARHVRVIDNEVTRGVPADDEAVNKGEVDKATRGLILP